MRRAWVWFVLLCLVSTVANAQYASKRAFRVVRADGSEVNGDSGCVVAVYPCSLGAVVPDTSGRRIDATWFTNPRRWEVEVDITNAYSFYYRAACCLDTLAVPLECIPLVGPDFAAGAIEAEDLASNAAVVNMIASRSDSGVVLADTLTATTIRALSDLVVQPGTTDLIRMDDAGIRLIGVGITMTTGEIDQTGGGYTTTGVVEAGFAASDIHDFTGIVSATNDVTSGDDVTVGDDLTVTDNATLGNADGDLTTVRDLEVANEANFSSTVTTVLGVTVGNDAADLLNVVGDLTVADVTTLNGAMNLGNATSDVLTGTGDFTWEGDFDVEDSLAVNTDGSAADTLKSAIRYPYGFIEGSAMSFKQITLAGGVSSSVTNWPGIREGDFVSGNPCNGSGASGLSSNWVWDITGNGKLTITRSGTTNSLILCLECKKVNN